MNINKHLLAALTVATIASAGSSRADFIVAYTNGPGMARFTDDGQFVREFAVYWGYFGETMTQPALGPDGLIYALANDLGYATLERFDPETGLAVDRSSGIRRPFSGWMKIPDYWAGPGPAFGPTGDLFAISYDFDFDGVTEPTRVLRINGANGELKSATPAVRQYAIDIVARPFSTATPFIDTEVVVSIEGGKLDRYRSGHSAAGTPTWQFVDTLDPGVSGVREIELGPDGLLYMMDVATRSIVRYDLDAKSIVDTFIANIPTIPGTTVEGSFDYSHPLGLITFAPDGDLFFLNVGLDSATPHRMIQAEIRRYDGRTGQFKGVQLTMPPIDQRRIRRYEGILYLPVPEPTTFLLGTIFLAAALAARRRAR